jgi:hypothetical protein
MVLARFPGGDSPKERWLIDAHIIRHCQQTRVYPSSIEMLIKSHSTSIRCYMLAYCVFLFPFFPFCTCPVLPSIPPFITPGTSATTLPAVPSCGSISGTSMTCPYSFARL